MDEINCGKMPEGYAVVYFDEDEHYHWVRGEQMSEMYSSRFDARNAARAYFRQTIAGQQYYCRHCLKQFYSRADFSAHLCKACDKG